MSALLAFCAGNADAKAAKSAKKRGSTASYYELLPGKKIEALKKGPCTLVHVWATWCTICLQELPELIRWLSASKQVHPVIIDISSPFVQENFSKKWLESLKPPFKTYLKPPGKDEDYVPFIDKAFEGTLPYSALYHKGRKQKTWIGALSLGELRATVDSTCK